LVPPLPISELSALVGALGNLTDRSGAGRLDRVARLVERLSQIYCGHIGIESAHIDERSVREWIAQRVEAPWATDGEALRRAIRILVKADEFERFMAVRFTGKKRFGAEGAEIVVAALDRLLFKAAGSGIWHVIIGTMHRGRLNTIATVLGKPL